MNTIDIYLDDIQYIHNIYLKNSEDVLDIYLSNNIFEYNIIIDIDVDTKVLRRLMDMDENELNIFDSMTIEDIDYI